MDPQATLNCASEALDKGDLDLADERLAAYREWRAKGGFEPPGGDRRLEELTALLAEQGDYVELCDYCGEEEDECCCDIEDEDEDDVCYYCGQTTDGETDLDGNPICDECAADEDQDEDEDEDER